MLFNTSRLPALVTVIGAALLSNSPGHFVASTVTGTGLTWIASTVFYSSPHCGGATMLCGGVPAGTCCVLPAGSSFHAKSFSVTVPKSNTRMGYPANDYRAFSGRDCLGQIYDAKPGGCASGASTYTSGKWYSSVASKRSHRRLAASHLEERSDAPCTIASSFGYADEVTGEHVVINVPANATWKGEFIRAVEENDVPKMKKYALFGTA